MEEKETILKEIAGDIICAAISIYCLNMLLTSMYSWLIESGIGILDKLK